MLEAELCGFREESGDEELSVLPRHTKVIVTGNNRTKSILVGLQGVVKKAVGLGGWHWLVFFLSTFFSFTLFGFSALVYHYCFYFSTVLPILLSCGFVGIFGWERKTWASQLLKK